MRVDAMAPEAGPAQEDAGVRENPCTEAKRKDPLLGGTRYRLSTGEVCDYTTEGGDWYLVAEDTFEGNKAESWAFRDKITDVATAPKFSTCNGVTTLTPPIPIAYSYKATKTYDIPVMHSQARVEVEFVRLGPWNSRVVQVIVDGRPSPAVFDGRNPETLNCSSNDDSPASGADHKIRAISPHRGNTMTVLVAPYLDGEGTPAKAWGLRRVAVWVRSNGLRESACEPGKYRYGTECRSPFGSCKDIKVAFPALGDGDYVIDPDGTESKFDPMMASCDMSQGVPGKIGGWTLILNYRRKADSKAHLSVKDAYLPRVGSANSTLGGDESNQPELWGHASTDLLAKLKPSDLRFFCKTSAHARTMHFAIFSQAVMGRVTSRKEPFGSFGVAYNTFSDHTAKLPNTPPDGGIIRFNWDMFDNYEEYWSDLVLTQQPFYFPFAHHWGVDLGGFRWECDDYTLDANNKVIAESSTLHRVWAR
jgi:hypothetical protein